jgi:spore germination protein GerM
MLMELAAAAAIGTAAPAATSATVHVYFLHAEHGVAVHRVAPARTPATTAVRGLLAGPTAAERHRGLSSTVPSGSRLLGLTVKHGLATVDLSSRFASGGGSASMNWRLAQLVYTLTAVAGVDRVNLRLQGRLVRVFSGEGLLLRQPLRRSDYPEFIP